MKRNTVILISLVISLLLAGLCSCKQEVTSPEKNGSIPQWEKSTDGLQNLPDIDTSGTGTGVSEALINGLNNPPEFKKAKNLIVIVCEGLTSELIESSTAQYGGLIINSFPKKGNTSSLFTDAEGKLLVDYIRKEEYEGGIGKNVTGIMAWGDVACNSIRRIATTSDNATSAASIYDSLFMLNPSLVYVMGKGDFSYQFSRSSENYLNDVFKSKGRKVSTLDEAILLYDNADVVFSAAGHEDEIGYVRKLYTIFDDDNTLPPFRREMAFSLAWMQWKKNSDGFCLFAAYSPSGVLDGAGVKDFDEGVAVAVKFALENPDTAILICGCPADGSQTQVCFYGLGKDVSVKNTLFECVSALN